MVLLSTIIFSLTNLEALPPSLPKKDTTSMPFFSASLIAFMMLRLFPEVDRHINKSPSLPNEEICLAPADG